VKSDFASEAGPGVVGDGSACRAAGVGTRGALARRAFDCLVESWQALRRRGLAGRCPPGPRPLDGDGLPLMALGESPPVTRCSSPAARGVSGSKP